MNSWLIMKQSKVPAESDGKPVDELDNRDKADSKAKTAKPSEAGDEVEPRHLGGALKLCKTGKSQYFYVRGHVASYQTLQSFQRRD